MTGSAPVTSVTFYVSPSGKDSWSGTLPAPNGAGTDGPFATFDRARAAVQSLNKSGLTQVSVQFRAGTYSFPPPNNSRPPIRAARRCPSFTRTIPERLPCSAAVCACRIGPT
jgi:hypothetical protein